MKVTGIEAFHVTVPLETPYILSKLYGTVRHAHAVVTKVTTDSGLTGYGEADPLPPFTEESWGSTFAAIEHHLGPALLGRDPRRISYLNARFDQVLSRNLVAKGALEVALWDLLGKSLGAPVHQLLGGAMRTRIPLLWPFGSASPEEDVDRIGAKLEEGFRTFMIKMGAQDIDTEVRRVEAIEKAYGGRIQVNVDANQGWTVTEALRFVDRTRELKLDFVEQPVRASQPWAFDLIRRRSGHPLSADESVQTLQQAAELAASHAVDVFSLKISKNGGIQRTRQIGDLAAAFGLRCLMNSMIELGITQAASLHVGASLPNLFDSGHCYMSTLRLADDVTSFSELIERAVAQVPDGPGLGIDVDEERLAKYTQESIRLS